MGYDGSKLGSWTDQANSPAAPEGQQQAARAGQNFDDRGPGWDQSALGKWTSQEGYVNQARSWYTGANQEGTNNGWDQDFADKFIKGQDKAAKEHRLGSYFADPDAETTGVVTWDHKAKDGTDLRFGDIFEDGEKVGNVYDQFPDKDGTADLMMADWLFDGKTKAKIFGSSDAMERLSREVNAKREQNAIDIPKSIEAMDFSEDVDKREKQMREGFGDEAVVGGGALATGVIGAGVGSLLPGVGTAVGFGVGTAVGGVVSFLNKDELTESAARAYEITAKATDENGGIAGTFEGVHQWSGFAGKLFQPTSNLTHGLTDLVSGDIGDGESAFYKLDDKGDRVAPTWLKAIDKASMLVDGVAQFSNPVGLAAYTAQMSTMIGGEVGSLVASGGETFDDRQGGFDNIFTDDKGNFDLGSAAAGIGNVGIDVVQLGLTRGLASKADSSMLNVGQEATYKTGGLRDKLPVWAGGRNAETREVLAAGGHEVELAGSRVLVDSSGKAVSRRRTLSLLAPSEQVTALTVGAVARREASAAAGATKVDDWYRAAQSISVGEKKMRTAVLNGFGEGYEEAIQQVLEPWSHNASPDFREVIEAFTSGAAMGAGMSAGFNLNTASADQKMSMQAKSIYMQRSGDRQITDADWNRQWKGKSDTEKRVAATASKPELMLLEGARKKIASEQARSMAAGTIESDKLVDAVQQQLSGNLKRATDRTDASFVITQLESAGRVLPDGSIDPMDPYTMPMNAAGASARQTFQNFVDHMRGMQVNRKTVEGQLADLQARAAQNPEDIDLPNEVAAKAAELEGFERVMMKGAELLEDMQQHIDRIYSDTSTTATVEAEIAVMNAKLRAMFNEEDPTQQTPEDKRAMARAVSMVYGRNPLDNPGSFQILVPQVSPSLTLEGTDNVVQVSHAVLTPMSADYDGDKLQPLNQIILDDDAFTSLRSGTNYLSADGVVTIPAPKHEQYNIALMSDALAVGTSTLGRYAAGVLFDIATAVRGRYAGVVEPVVLERVLSNFIEAVKSNDKDARAQLLDGLARSAGGAITDFARGNISVEWIWLDQLIVSHVQRFQSAYAAHRPDIGKTIDYLGSQPTKRSAEVGKREVARAAVLGQDLQLQTTGDSLFRSFQKIHYTSISAQTFLDAEFGGERAALEDMALFYESLGQNMTESEVEMMRGKDAITGRVYVALNRIATQFAATKTGYSNMQAMSVIANLRVQDLEWDLETNTYTDKNQQITLAQLLLKQSVMKDKRDKDAIIDASPELQSKHARLLAMTTPSGHGKSNPVNAERTFVEIVSDRQLYELLGDEAMIFGPHLTVEQWIRGYSAFDEDGRTSEKSKLHREAAYLGKAQAKDMPYDLTDLEDISAYRAVTDAMVAVGNKRIAISHDKKGTLSGELAERSAEVSKNFQASIKNAQTAFRNATGRKDGEISAEFVQRIFREHPDTGRAVMALISNQYANVVIGEVNGELSVSPWIYEMFTVTPVEAEMIYYRNTLLAEFNALGSTTDFDGATAGESGRTYQRFSRRMHRVIYNLHPDRMKDGGLALQRFETKLAESSNLAEFIRWVNTTPGLRGMQAPLLGWIDDVAEFDPDKASGGWTKNLQGAEQREAIANLRLATERLNTTLTEERAAEKVDVVVKAAIRRVLEHDAGNTDINVQPGDREHYRKMVRAIEHAKTMPIGTGIQTMIAQSMGALEGFNDKSHTKGQNPGNTRPNGLFEALRDALGYDPNFDRVMASLTAINESAVNGNPGYLAGSDIRMMDEHGRPVEWSMGATETDQVRTMLDLLDNEQTMPLARAILFPQVIERTAAGQVTTQLLTGKSLKSLLEGTTYNDMFPKNGVLSRQAAAQYVIAVEALARKHGGNFALQRAVNDYVIAQTSAATAQLTEDQKREIVSKAYYDFARVLQGVGAVEAAPTGKPDPLEPIRRLIKKAAREAQIKAKMGSKGGEPIENVEAFLDVMVEDRKDQFATELAALTTLKLADPNNAIELDAQLARAEADHEAFLRSIDFMRSDDQIGMVVEMYRIPENDPVGAEAKKKGLVEYFQTHPGFIQRSSSSWFVSVKLSQQLIDSGRVGMMPNLTDAEWVQLSNAIIGDYLTNASTKAAYGVSVSPFPDGDHKRDQRYFDTTFSYLVDDLLDSKSPLVLAARELQMLAERIEDVPDSEIVTLLTRTIFDDFKLGRHTPEITALSVAANERLDSAAAEPAISMYGQLPKTQAVISAATRRTYRIPGPELLSTVSLATNTLQQPLFNEVAVTMPGQPAPVSIPLAQLNNRFASSAIATFPDGSTEDLLQTTEAGRSFASNAAARDSGYKGIHIERLHSAMVDAAVARDIDPATVRVELSFFHPDSQPTDVEGEPTWYNNLFFEGTVYELDADDYDSLNAAGYFAPNGISQRGQRASLDASKLGKPALEIIDMPEASKRKETELDALTDLAKVLRAKTKIMLEQKTKLHIEDEHYNFVYKNLKLRHMVRGTIDGQPTAWTAEQVIEFQVNNPGTPLPLEDPSLFVLSSDVLRTMLGEQGTQGVARILRDQLEVDLAAVPRYKGLTEKMLEQFRPGFAGENGRIENTGIVNRAHQSQARFNIGFNEKERSRWMDRMHYLDSLRSDIWLDRSQMTGGSAGSRFDTKANLLAALQAANLAAAAENIYLDWSPLAPFVGSRNPSNPELSRMLLHDLVAAINTENPSRTGWIYREGATTDLVRGILTQEALGSERKGKYVAPDDLVVVEVDTFGGDLKLARKRLEFLADRGTFIYLGSGDGSTDGRPEMAVMLEALGYEKVAGSPHLFQPADLGSRFQNVQARNSTLLEYRGVSPRGMVSILNMRGKYVEENAAWVNLRRRGEGSSNVRERLNSLGVGFNLMPLDVFRDFNVPATPAQIERVREGLRTFDDGDVQLEHLTDLSVGENGTDEQRAEFQDAFRRMIQRFDTTPAVVLPQPGEEFGTGDLIPLVNHQGQVLLYRHGYKAPRNREAVMAQAALVRPGSADAANVASYTAKRQDEATTYRGKVVEVSTRKGFGWGVELALDSEIYGDKFQVEWSGMKIVPTPMPADMSMPDHGFLGNREIDFIVSADDSLSKQSFEGTVNNHRAGFAYFGIDFMPDLKKFFGVDNDREIIELLRAIETHDEAVIPLSAAQELLTNQRAGSAFTSQLLTATGSLRDTVDTSWINRIDDLTPEAQIARAILTYIMVPGTSYKQVLRSGSFADESSSIDAQSILMPQLFTQYFDDAPFGSPLRTEINDRFNRTLNNAPGKAAGTGYRLLENWDFHVMNGGDGSKDLWGTLQIAEAHSSGDNPVRNGMSYDEDAKAPVSQHTAAIAYQAIGAGTGMAYDLGRAQAFIDGAGLTQFAEDDADGGLWRMLTDTSTDTTFASWRMDTPAEAEARSLSRDAMINYTRPIPKDDPIGWTADQAKTYRDLTQQIMTRLGLAEAQAGIVDGWVRQWGGMPDGLNDEGKQHHVNGRQATEWAQEILTNVNGGYLPVVGGMVSLLHLHDLQAIYRANRESGNWAPRIAMDPDSPKAETWEDWVNVSLGGALTNNENFDPLDLTAMDGFMHTYQNATDSLLDLPVSLDSLKAQNLLMPENNQRFLASIDPNTQQRIEEPALLDSDRLTLDDMLGGHRVAGRYRNRMPRASERTKRLSARRKWRAENGVPMPVDVTMTDFRKNGTTFIDNSTTTNALVRSLINLRVGTALINPALYISMGPEMMVRAMIDQTANLLTLQATTGRAAGAVARMGVRHESKIALREEKLNELLNNEQDPERRAEILKEIDALPTEGLFARMGLDPAYTPDQLDKLNVLYGELSERKEFTRMILRSLDFVNPHAESASKIEKATAWYAKFGSKIQDPTTGIRNKTLARRYMMAAIEHIMYRPTVNPISIETLISEMHGNPRFLERHYEEAHLAGVAATAQARSLKATTWSVLAKSVYEPLSAHTNVGINVASNILLKLPLLFSGYALNVASTITGLQGISDALAMFTDGREKSPFLLRTQAAMRGIDVNEYVGKYGSKTDMSEVLEGIDLSRSFVRAGVTHTSLMAFGLLAGNLGLTGEDDEERRRRRAAELQGAAFVYDPRKMANDFRNADALWFGNTAVQMPWIAKQFISPIIGMERFFDTGDTRHITWGFQDALGSFPLINTMSWRDAVETGNDFIEMANDSADKGTKEGLTESHNLLTSMVGTYERMLFENAFVNQIYQASDKYDRNPYVQPMLDSDEVTQVDSMGQPRPTDALRPYFDEDPETGKMVLKQGYQSRDQSSATLHSLTENRATLAGALSIFTGLGDSSFFRQNMAIKTRSVEAPLTTSDEARAAVRALSGQQGGQAMLTPEESLNRLRNAGVGGKYARNSELEPIAAKDAAAAGVAPLSVLDAKGKEILTKDGAKAVLRGLAKGSVNLGDASLAGLHITFEQREEIAAEWMQDIIQEGIDLGLDKTKATKRMNRLWYGPQDDPKIQGLGDILFSKDISYSDTLEYNQLNTTFVKGPDGLPWATGFGRSALFGSVKFQTQIEPDKNQKGDYVGVMSVDERFNSVDMAAGQNLGMRALEPINAPVPTDVEIGKAIEKAIEKAAGQQYAPLEPFGNSSGGGGGGYGRRGGGYGGGGGGGYAPNVFFSRMNPFPNQRAPYADGIPFINTSNPILRRADVRRERVWSERGRLKQWQ